MELEPVSDSNVTPFFRPDCKNCTFCDGLKDFGPEQTEAHEEEKGPSTKASELFNSLSFLDRYLAVFILLAMVCGILIGVYAERGVREAFGGAQWKGVSIPVLVGLLLMMWRTSALHFTFIVSRRALLRSERPRTVTHPHFFGFQRS
ncbi:hypothetical protein M407DRAFT_145761 [Tulasnella calospora MUT 4182]|uniref:Uncharacterized protein n=1 Tax=Tulasnella calospora MUT 4182 TaxID=1051891 RepID=A0A0C3MAS2_9AGAM|nr:hypothetical protein M407DRAFT_145761 [Tulasnella calospora MUT 4182]